MEAVHRRASGTPRVINTLCDNALFEAFLGRSQEIRGAMIEQIADNLGLETGKNVSPEVLAAQAAQPTVPAVAPVAAPASFQPPPGIPSAIRRDPELAVEGGMTVTATVQGGAVPVSSPRALTTPPPPPSLIGSAPTGTQSAAPRASSPSQASLVPPVQPVAPQVPPPPPPSIQLAPVPPPPVAAAPAEASDPNARPRTGVDLAEIDRYLEGLGKL
jgi:hypothetical protein